MIIELIIISFFIGVISTLPIGPAGINIIDNYVKNGHRKALECFYGLLTVEVIYLALSYFIYKSGVAEVFFSNQIVLSAIFSIVLVGIGLSFLLSNNRENLNLPSGFKGTFSLVIINPGLVITYLTFMAFYERIFQESMNFGFFLLGSFSMIIGVATTLLSMSLVAKKKEELIQGNLLLIKRLFGIFFITTAVCSLGGAI